MSNPFSLTFGKEPISIVNRNLKDNDIIDSFLDSNPAYQVCMITGVRGSGKTVSLTTISHEIQEHKDWIVVDLNPERDMLHMLTAELCNKRELLQMIKEAKINLSLLGLGIEIAGEPPITDIVVALERILQKLTQKGKRLLVTIDEASSSKYVKEFASQFQIFMRKNYNVFLLMTGLYENIYELQNEKTLTFLYRAPKIELQPLNIGMIADKYKSIFSLDDKSALDMAKMTKGYPFAYQVLGYLCYREKKTFDKVLVEYDAYLEEYVYEKIWSELSGTDKSVIKAMATAVDTKVESIRRELEMSSNSFTVYRKRLLKKGIVKSTEYGHLEYVLPRFKEFVLRVI